MASDGSTRPTQYTHTRKYRPQHWLIELIEDGRRKKSVLLEGNRRNISFYIRKNTEYLMPFYRAMWKMAVSQDGEIEMGGKMLSTFEGTMPMTSETIEEMLTEYENDELIEMFNVVHKPGPGKEVCVNLTRLPPSWNTRPRRRMGGDQGKAENRSSEKKETNPEE